MTIRYQALWMALVYKTDLITIHGTHGIFRIQAHIWAVAASWAREGNGTPLQYSCLENSMDAGAWWAAVHGVAKSWTWLSNFTFTFHFDSLEKEMATHSSVLAWRSPWTEELGGLQSTGSQRVGHDWATEDYSKTRFQWKLGVLAPVSSSASGSVEGTGPQSARGRPCSFVPIVMHLDAPKEPYDLYFYAPDAWVPSHIATKQPPPTPPLPPKLPPPPRGGRPQRLEPLSPATLPNNFLWGSPDLRQPQTEEAPRGPAPGVSFAA